MDRVKVSDKFRFPVELEASMFTNDHSGPPVYYDLQGILLHKGTSARQGHYVAHIKLSSDDGGKNTWWRFDDTDVKKLLDGSVGHPDHGCRPKMQSNKKNDETVGLDMSCVETQTQMGAVVDCPNNVRTENIDPESTKTVNEISSSNAYLLVYRKRGEKNLTGSFLSDSVQHWCVAFFVKSAIPSFTTKLSYCEYK